MVKIPKGRKTGGGGGCQVYVFVTSLINYRLHK